MNYLGVRKVGSKLIVTFPTYDLEMGSVTITGLATSDIKIYKNDSMTQRSSTAGFALMDTDGIDLDGITGIHGFTVDLADNTDAGFFTAGASYWGVVDSVTANSKTVRYLFSFDLEEEPATKEEIIDGLWDALLADHGDTGSMGEALAAAASGGSAPTASEIADAVWDEATAGHTGIGSAGKALLDIEADAGDILTDTADMQPKLGTISDLGGGATIGANLATIEAQTDDIGAAGAGLTALASASALSTLDGKVVTLDGKVVTLDGKVVTLDGKVVTVDSVVNGIASDLAVVDGKVDTIDTNVDSILDDTGTAGVVVASASVTAIVNGLGAKALEGAITWEQAFRGMAAVLMGKASGLDTTEATYRDLNDTKDRIVSDNGGVPGNRDTVTRDLS